MDLVGIHAEVELPGAVWTLSNLHSGKVLAHETLTVGA